MAAGAAASIVLIASGLLAAVAPVLFASARACCSEYITAVTAVEQQPMPAALHLDDAHSNPTFTLSLT
jgi:hypothetical protein